MGDKSKAEVLEFWSKIEDVYFVFFRDLKAMNKFVTPEVERDFFNFRLVMRKTVNEAANPGELSMNDIYEKLPGNKWIPILVYYSTKIKAILNGGAELRVDQSDKKVALHIH